MSWKYSRHKESIRLTQIRHYQGNRNLKRLSLARNVISLTLIFLPGISKLNQVFLLTKQYVCLENLYRENILGVEKEYGVCILLCLNMGMFSANLW